MGGRFDAPHCHGIGKRTRWASLASLQILAVLTTALDAPEAFLRLAMSGLTVDDPFAILAGDLPQFRRGVWCLGQSSFSLELLADGG